MQPHPVLPQVDRPEYNTFRRHSVNNSEMQAPHFQQHSAQIDGFIGDGPQLVSSSLSNDLRGPTSANYSNVQVVCRINAPAKNNQTQPHRVMKRSSSAHKHNFSSGSALMSHRSHQGGRNEINYSQNPATHRSYASVSSTPAQGRSPSKFNQFTPYFAAQSRL